MTTRAITVHPPDVAARRLGGISTAKLIEILKAGGYSYTSLGTGAAPWGRGRKCWGLTDDQIAAVAAGQQRTHARPEAAGAPARPAVALPGHDGKSRLRKRGAKA